MRILVSAFFGFLCVFRSLASSQVYLGKVGTSPEKAYNVTDNLIFTTVASLLQQWPNTRYRNGHTIVKGTIPAGTTLYHGRWNNSVPDIPEWLATNVEHSYVLCHPSECWMLTFAVEKELNIVYFDGSSAANADLGHQDSQDLVIYGKVRPDKVMGERERIERFCEWGAKFNIDAIVRMEPGFEVMLCNFSKNVKLVSSVHIMAANDPRRPLKNLTGASTLDLFHHRQLVRSGGHDLHIPELSEDSSPSPGHPDEPHKIPPLSSHPRPPFPGQPLPPTWQGPLRDANTVKLEAVQAAAWNNFYPGETRVKLSYTRLISFYDPSLTSLVQAREGIARDYHRLTKISKEDYKTAMRQLEEDLKRKDPGVSAVDWGTLTRTVMDRYADRLYFLKELLSPQNLQLTSHTAAANRVREHLLMMLSPYLIYGALPVETGNQDGSWTTPITHQCSSQLTALIKPEVLVRSEVLIKRAVEGVLHRICSTLTDIWVDAFSVTTASEERAAELLMKWGKELESLMRWLDWPVWDVCRPSCSQETFCYIPTWPWGFPETTKPEDQANIDMTPRCIDRTSGNLRRDQLT